MVQKHLVGKRLIHDICIYIWILRIRFWIAILIEAAQGLGLCRLAASGPVSVCSLVRQKAR